MRILPSILLLAFAFAGYSDAQTASSYWGLLGQRQLHGNN